MSRRTLAFTTVVVTLSLLSVTTLDLGVASATEIHSPPDLWFDLQAGLDGRLSYGLCAEGLNGESSWGPGVETWDSLIGIFEFDPGPCVISQVRLMWESVGGSECPPDANGNEAIACWMPTGTNFGSYFRLNSAIIYFDRTKYPAEPSDPPYDDRLGVVMHEWGHNLSLTHTPPVTAMCTLGTIMGYQPNNCFTSPTGADRHTVTCRVYKRWCTSTVTAGDWGSAATHDDFVVSRPSNGLWLMENVQGIPGGSQGQFNGNGTVDTQIQFGIFTDAPAPGLFSADTRMDPAVYRPCESGCVSALSYW